MKQTVEDLLALQAIVVRLESRYPGRKFTLDGHLVGSIGEVWAAHLFDITLLPPSQETHDAIGSDGRLVQIKATQGDAVGISSCPDNLIVLVLNRDGGVEVVYDGPGDIAWAVAGKMAKTGQRALRLSKLRALQTQVPPEARLPRRA
jgi:hypothetical protein